MTDISKFIPDLSYTSLIYSRVLSGDSPNREDTLTLVAFNDTFPSVRDVETGILDLVLNASSECKDAILESLHTDLNVIVALYNENKHYYDQLNLHARWIMPLNYLNMCIEEQRIRTQEINEELIMVSNSFEMSAFNGSTKEEIGALERRCDKLRTEYNEEYSKLTNFYAEHESVTKEINSIPFDIFKTLSKKCNTLLHMVKKYYCKLSDRDSSQTVVINNFFSMSLIAPVYDLCNGNQFNIITDSQFFEAINLHPNSRPLVVRRHEKARVCFLIGMLSLKIAPDRRDEWLQSILTSMNISFSYYRSKYRVPVSDLPSKKNREFAEVIKELLC